jgi:hypothetical protein
MKSFAQSQIEFQRIYSAMFFSIIIKSIDANLILDVMCNFLRDSSMKARLYALDSLIHFSDDDIFRQNFQPLLPNILEVYKMKIIIINPPSSRTYFANNKKCQILNIINSLPTSSLCFTKIQ